jgi:hypothetical protein
MCYLIKFWKAFVGKGLPAAVAEVYAEKFTSERYV